ncbi:hypothetical protein F9L33_03210 [Amylibacter sp. SFDW26]|uniref:Hint domain-containing protein n=1 Tax=Amylibacter sp. SFDW26 TaxID=2652722 RepID=UPI001261FBA9|nr:Hint domain-containing protein [Amylibacter sp. SFDW26]KAB7615785.1 hypothetical protein F9L33_03210 [Amylibacter sp. SFDW26]
MSIVSDRSDFSAPYGAWIVAGSRIFTKFGVVRIESLSIDDEVITRSNGFQRIQYLGNTRQHDEKFKTSIMIKTGVINNEQDIFVSPDHKILVYGSKIKQEFGKLEYLVAAKDLINGSSIVKLDANDLEYHCVLFEKHEVIYVEGAALESFNLNDIKAQGGMFFDKGMTEIAIQKQASFTETTKPILNRTKASVLRDNPDLMLRD